MDFTWSDEDLAFRSEVRSFLERELPDRWYSLVPGEEPASDFTFQFCRKLGAEGLLAPHWPLEYGGRDASGWQFIILGEELWRAGEPRGAQYMNVNWIGPAIIEAGSLEQKRYHLRRMTAGDVVWCQGFSEPEAGTDLASLVLDATRDGDEYVLNGTKIWTSYASHAHFCFVLGRTDPASAGPRGISIFLVPTDTPGLTIEPLRTVLDIHVIHRLSFDGVRVGADAMLGPENEGWGVIRNALAHERIGGPRYARAEMVLDRIQQRCVDDGRWRRRDVRATCGRARATIEAARLLAYHVIDDRVKGRPNAAIVPLARVAMVRSERAVTHVALELLGSEALGLDSIGNSQLKTSMIAGLGGGSVEVQLNGIARSLFQEREA